LMQRTSSSLIAFQMSLVMMRSSTRSQRPEPSLAPGWGSSSLIWVPAA
jgi:hypothetical protein